MTSNPNKRDIESASSLALRLGLSFSNLSLLIRALTHTSYANEHQDASEDNERLEFLGDAVLDFVVGEWVYHRFPDLPEGNLTKIRSSLVKNERLAEFSRQLKLSDALRLGRGEQTTGGDKRESMLGSLFEALVGAIYLDSHNMEKVKTFVYPFLVSMRETVLDELNDPKSILQEWSQANKLGTPKYKIISATGPDHAKEFEMEVVIAGEVKGRGSGTSKNSAERAAAANAIINLGIS